MHKLEQDSVHTAERLHALREAAAQLPDGRKVFQSRNGRVYTEDSKDVTHHPDSLTGLSGSSPSWEEFQEARNEAEGIEQRKREVETYRREVINPAKERLAIPIIPLRQRS